MFNCQIQAYPPAAAGSLLENLLLETKVSISI